jgi:hypothetical protein
MKDHKQTDQSRQPATRKKILIAMVVYTARQPAPKQRKAHLINKQRLSPHVRLAMLRSQSAPDMKEMFA